MPARRSRIGPLIDRVSQNATTPATMIARMSAITEPDAMSVIRVASEVASSDVRVNSACSAILTSESTRLTAGPNAFEDNESAVVVSPRMAALNSAGATRVMLSTDGSMPRA